MIAHRHDGAQWTSNSFALLLTVVLLALILSVKRPQSWREFATEPAQARQPDIEVATQETVAAAPPVPDPPLPKARILPERRLAPRQAIVAKTESPDVALPQTPEAPIPEGGAVVAASEAPPSATPTAVSRSDLEAQYAAGLRADIDHRTHPPDSMQYRLRRPSGEVRVGFIVLRSGEAKGTRVLISSGSSILDEAAVSIVSSGHYPPMSAKLFNGEAEHSFSVTIEFRASG